MNRSGAAAAPFARRAAFWSGCALLCAGILLHLPMTWATMRGGGAMPGMAMDPMMALGMALIAAGAAAACWGALPPMRRAAPDAVRYEAAPDARLGRPHILLLLVLVVALVIDTMKPATLGFVLPGMGREYGIGRETAALLPLFALIGTVVGSLIWGWLADRYGRRVSIILSTILFIATSVCGAMPSLPWNLLMCFLMGASAGGMMPVVYTLLAETMPARSRSWILVLVGGTGLIGGYLAASLFANLLEPPFGWRSLWLQGFPTGLLLLGLARFIPESPGFLAAQGRPEEAELLARRFGLEANAMPRDPAPAAPPHRGLGAALVVTALAWSFVNFGLLLWLPSDLQARGYSAELASGIIARSALIALPTVALAAWLYSRWSSKWTLAGSSLLTAFALAATLLIDEVSSDPALVVTVVALLLLGSNAVIAVLLPYAAENYRLAVRGRATGLVAGSSKLGGVAVQAFFIAGFVPPFGIAALALIAPMAGAAALVGWAGRETRGRSLGALEGA